MYFYHANPSLDSYFCVCVLLKQRVPLFGKQQYNSFPKPTLDLEYIEAYGFGAPAAKHYLLPLTTTRVEYTHPDTHTHLHTVCSLIYSHSGRLDKAMGRPSQGHRFADCLS